MGFLVAINSMGSITPEKTKQPTRVLNEQKSDDFIFQSSTLKVSARCKFLWVCCFVFLNVQVPKNQIYIYVYIFKKKHIYIYI